MNRIIKEDAEYIAQYDLPWDNLKGKTVLISGASGYVPSYFIHAFMMRNDMFNSGIRVIALCRNEEKAKRRFIDYLGREDLELIIQDVCEPIDLCEDIRYFIHAASPAGLKISNIEPVSTFDANVLGCRQMLRLSLKNKAEGFLFLSSVDVYGKPETQKRFIETDSFALDSLNPRNVYACAKRATEALCACYCEQHGIPVVIVRPSQIMGPGIALDDGRLHVDFISQALTRRKITLKSDGTAVRSFVYITDAVAGMLTVLMKGTRGEAYNVADEKGELTVLELAGVIASLPAEKADIVFDSGQRNAPEVKHALSSVTAVSAKLRSLGWKTIYTPTDAARRMYDYYKGSFE